ncbi:MAG: helix-turn-helix domain-containing protein [Bacteroidales bacterium]
MRTIYIKNMVCDRCTMAVRAIFAQQNVVIDRIVLGEVTIAQPISPTQHQALKEKLESIGFEWIDDKRSLQIEQIKNLIRELVHHNEGALTMNLSDYLAEQLRYDYSSLTSLFSEVEGTTIEQYYIAQKIERVKELLVYNYLTLGEIAHQLNYSSTAHLSAQFKKVTGLTTTYYKQLANKRRQALDKI